MEIREANATDQDEITEVARQSLQASYALSPAIIDEAVTQWHGDEAFTAALERSDRLVLVAVRDDDVVGFTESTVGASGDVHWLHVAPADRGRGIGSELFDRTLTVLEERGAKRLRGCVLNVNAEGNAFYERHGLRRVDSRRVDVGGRSFVENIYARTVDAKRETVTTQAGEQLYLAPDHDQGSNGVFQAVYTDPERTEQYGYYCARCDGLATAMDAMGRLECADCGNVSKPARWDAAYL